MSDSDSDSDSEMNQLDYDLIRAISYGDLTKTRMLLNQGANINARPKSGESALWASMRHGSDSPYWFEFIIENGYDFKEYSKYDEPLGFNLMMLFMRGTGGDVEMSRIVLKYFPFDLNFIDNEGFSLLHRIIFENERLWNALPFIKFLLENGANINAQVENDGYLGGNTALILMAREVREWGLYKDLKDIIELLFAYGANQTIKNNDGETVFDIDNRIWPIFRQFRHNREVTRRGILQVGANLPSHVNENIYNYLYYR
jgi:ankyrin repeat protein